jgi:hypothetical protein
MYNGNPSFMPIANSKFLYIGAAISDNSIPEIAREIEGRQMKLSNFGHLH